MNLSSGTHGYDRSATSRTGMWDWLVLSGSTLTAVVIGAKLFSGTEQAIPGWAEALFFGGITVAWICSTRVIANWLELDASGLGDDVYRDRRPTETHSQPGRLRS